MVNKIIRSTPISDWNFELTKYPTIKNESKIEITSEKVFENGNYTIKSIVDFNKQDFTLTITFNLGKSNMQEYNEQEQKFPNDLDINNPQQVANGFIEWTGDIINTLWSGDSSEEESKIEESNLSDLVGKYRSTKNGDFEVSFDPEDDKFLIVHSEKTGGNYYVERASQFKTKFIDKFKLKKIA